MNTKKKEKIAYKKERVVLSDILPYEVPAIFNNRYFYRFLVENEIGLNGEKIRHKEGAKKGLNDVIKIIFSPIPRTIPFEFRISHKDNSYRSLAIIHPLNQLHVVAFYNEFKETIKYFANVSQYSIRKPYKVAKTRFVNDYIHQHQQQESENASNIEIYKDKDENLKTFFSYEKYSNIYKFFESHEYQRAEKKFTHLYKFDIGKCFDSIYTHSISWALYEKGIVKDNIPSSKTTFAGKFDTLMQSMNYGETNGILIGPEVSRIFAELLLQQVDKAVFDELFHDGKIHKKDYEVFRYVDDYFLFCSDEMLKNTIKDKFIHHLKQYNLFINEAKSYEYSRPIITDLTIAKIKIVDLIDDKLGIKKNKEKEKEKGWSIGFKSKDLITRFKIIIRESNIEYKDVVNYSIAIIEKKALKVILKIENEEDIKPYKKDFISYFYNILDLIFFIYSVAPRVSGTVKIVSLLSKLLAFLKKNENINKHQKDALYKKIFDESHQIIKGNQHKKYVQNETLYLLIILAELNQECYFIDNDTLKKYFLSNTDNTEVNYFVITTLLFYIKNQEIYKNIKMEIIKEIYKKINNCNKDNRKKDSELVMLLLDSLSCPFISEKDKRGLLKSFGITENEENLIDFREEWFIKWENFDLSKEMELKKSQEVYS